MTEPFDGLEVSPDALVVKEMLDRVLEKVLSAYQSFNVPVPARHYWTIGQPAWDCEQLVVSLQTMNLGVPGDTSVATSQNCNGPSTATISISVIRRAAVPGNRGLPSGEKIQEYSIEPVVDAWVLQSSLPAIDSWSDGAPGNGLIVSTQMLSAQGDYHGVNMLISMVVS